MAAGPSRTLEVEALAVPALIAIKRRTSDLQRFRDQVRALPTMPTPEVLATLRIADDALLAWSAHLELTKRGIAPVLRMPLPDAGPQMDAIAFAADVLWIQRQHPNQAASFRGWRRVLSLPPASGPWHEAAHRCWLFAYRRGQLAHLTAKGLALTDAQRAPLITLPTRKAAAERRQLFGLGFVDLEARLLIHARAHPDSAGRHSPHEVASRRARLWRVHVLAGRSPTATAAAWGALTNQRLSRQQVGRHIAAVERVLD